MINRRNFIKSASLLATSAALPTSIAAKATVVKTETGEKILPKRLLPGNTIGLITPGSPITRKQLDETVSKLQRLGYKPYYRESVLDEYGYLAGTDNQRAEELMHMFTNRTVDAIMCVRGGYGSIRILDKLDYRTIRNNPKIFIGYSDITALTNTIHDKTGLVTFHGPLGISPFNDFTLDVFTNVLINPRHRYRYPYQREPGTDNNPEFDRYTVNRGKAKGILTGGNISVLDSMIGSKFEPDFENKIVFLEEVEEKTYRVDKMLYHLLYATNLKKAAGIAFGVFNKCNINDPPALTLKQAVNDLFKPLDIPVSYGLPFGHIDTIITIPTGIKAKLNADTNSLILLEKAVI